MSDWPLIEQNIKVDLAVDVREQAKKIKAPTLSITAKYDQIVPPFYTQELADRKPGDLTSAMLTFLLERHKSSLTRWNTDSIRSPHRPGCSEI
jgi:pimeloyl-ACP methyl ester carboxylesterase